ncbi:hypothetical protein ACRFCP_27155, partial [Klebsiella pneumoniae]
MVSIRKRICAIGFAPIFPDTCYHLTHYWPAAVDIPVASDNPVHYADAIRGTVAKLAMRQPFVLFKGLTFQKLCLP